MTFEDKLLEIVAYTLPALITGGVAFVMMQKFYVSDESKRKYELLRENQKQALPIRLQAFERVVLLLERINPSQLLLRVAPTGKSKDDYATLLTHNIQTEFEHNLAQQIYLTAASWDIVLKAKNSTIQMIRKNALREDVADADKLREAILIELTEIEAPSSIACTVRRLIPARTASCVCDRFIPNLFFLRRIPSSSKILLSVSAYSSMIYLLI